MVVLLRGSSLLMLVQQRRNRQGVTENAGLHEQPVQPD